MAVADVFVSYKAEDRRRVKPLVDAFEADGMSVWWDAQIGSGSAWRHAIETELSAAKCVVVAWSKGSVGPEGEFVRDEATRAKERRVYVPITIDKVQVPLGFGETQATSLVGWKGDRSDPRYLSVLGAARALVSGTPRPVGAHIFQPTVSRRAALAGGAGIVAIAGGAGAWFISRPRAAEASNRIAVLPFANLSGDPAQVYFSDGIAEELRSSLSHIGMQVIGRASSDAVKNLDTKTAAAKLGVANILSGSVRRSPDTIRIAAQLLSGSDGVERWSEAYDRPAGDSLKIQEDIAQNVAQALSIALGQGGREALNIGGTMNSAAQDLVLKVIHDSSDSMDSLNQKLALLDAAISADPNYAQAYAYKAAVLTGKAGIYATSAEANRRGQAEALAFANRAVAIAPKMALGYAVRATVYRQQLQVGPSLADAGRAVALPGENVPAIESYAASLSRIGQVEEALRLNGKAMSLDPLSAEPLGTRAVISYFGRRYAESVQYGRRSLAIAPNQGRIRGFVGDALLAQGKTSEAEAEFGKIDAGDYRRVVGEAVIAARAGRRAQALEMLKALEARNGDQGHFQYGEIYAQLGMIDDAFKELDLAFEARDPGLSVFQVDPFLDPLRKDPRMGIFARKLGVP